MKNQSFIKSLFHALEGIRSSFLTERNLRFHFVIGNLICVLAVFYGLDRASWAILLLTVFAVISAEIFNTALEKAVDTATEEIKLSAKISKDAAAGGVLVLSIGAVAVGICLFGDVEKITYTLTEIFTNIKNLVPCILLGIFDLYVLFGIKKG